MTTSTRPDLTDAPAAADGREAWTAAPAPARRSTASIAGHPLHPAVVPLPIGLLVGAVLSDIGHLLTGDRFFARASRWLLRGGIVTGAAAATLGATDLATIRQARGPVGGLTPAETPRSWCSASSACFCDAALVTGFPAPPSR